LTRVKQQECKVGNTARMALLGEVNSDRQSQIAKVVICLLLGYYQWFGHIRRIHEPQRHASPATGRTRKAKNASGGRTSFAPAKRGRRGMSAVGRKRISEMMKARWAARKKAAKA
jgi:hypothetical protein